MTSRSIFEAYRKGEHVHRSSVEPTFGLTRLCFGPPWGIRNRRNSPEFQFLLTLIHSALPALGDVRTQAALPQFDIHASAVVTSFMDQLMCRFGVAEGNFPP